MGDDGGAAPEYKEGLDRGDMFIASAGIRSLFMKIIGIAQ